MNLDAPEPDYKPKNVLDGVVDILILKVDEYFSTRSKYPISQLRSLSLD